MLNSLLAHAHGAADRFLDEYYHADPARNPFQIAQKQTVSVQIDSILQLSPKSYQVRWTEQARNLNGAAIGAPRRRAIKRLRRHSSGNRCCSG